METHEILVQSKSNERYTPMTYIDAARKVMGGIDLDPASCAKANKTVKAIHYFTKADNGLKQPWSGRVWLNPPYGRENGGQKKMWSRKLIEEYERGFVEQAILLVTASTGDVWFRPLWNYTICFPDHRIDFDGPEGPLKSGNTGSSVFVYFGKDSREFIEEFKRFGPVVTPDREVWRGGAQLTMSLPIVYGDLTGNPEEDISGWIDLGPEIDIMGGNYD